jgi:hypothetical protein
LHKIDEIYSQYTDQPAEIACLQCQDVFCEVCFHATHRKGSRKGHSTTPLRSAEALTNKKLGQAKSQQKNGVHKVCKLLYYGCYTGKLDSRDRLKTIPTTTKTGNMLLSQVHMTLLHSLVPNRSCILRLVNGLSNEAGISLSGLHMKSGSSYDW